MDKINNRCEYIDKHGEVCGKRCRNIIDNKYYCAQHKRTFLNRRNREDKAYEVMDDRQENQPRTFDNDRTIKTSIWVWYPNTNKTPEKLGKEGMDKFDTMCEMFAKPDIFLQFIQDKNFNCPPDMNKIINMKSHYMTEVGLKQNRYHGQITIEIVHDDCLKFDIAKLRQQMNEYMDFRDDNGNLQSINLKYSQPKYQQVASEVWVNYATKNTRRDDKK